MSQPFVERLLERELVPDALVRFQIRRLLKQRILHERQADQQAFVDRMREAPIAVEVSAANEQHYEVPAAFFQRVLGRHLKYSCGYYPTGDESLDQAEHAMLELTCERAEICDGQDILELGCGWGSLTLFMAERFPAARIVGVSNSHSQRQFIEERARARGLANVTIRTCDMNRFETDQTFDRVVSVEMFEHMRNVERLLGRIDSWLRADGRLFVHIFTHREFAYLFEDHDDSDWMARHFFTGGMMPSHALYAQLRSNLQIEQEWVVPGTHYARTAEHWLANMDRHEAELRELFAQTYGHAHVSRWWARWRVFFMACAELWRFRNGTEWQVSHYRFRKANP